MPLEQFKAEGWYCVLDDRDPSYSTIDRRFAEQLRSHMDSFNSQQGLYYDRAKGWSIDKKFGGIGSTKAAATKQERLPEATLKKKESDWQIIPYHRVIDVISSGDNLYPNTATPGNKRANAGKRKLGSEYVGENDQDQVAGGEESVSDLPTRQAKPPVIRQKLQNPKPVEATPKANAVKVVSGDTNTATPKLPLAVAALPVTVPGASGIDSEPGTAFSGFIAFYERDKIIKSSIADQRLHDRTLEFADRQHLRNLEDEGRRDERQKRVLAQMEGKNSTTINIEACCLIGVCLQNFKRKWILQIFKKS